MFAWMKRKVDTPKIEPRRVIVDVEVEDLTVSFDFRGGTHLRYINKEFLANAWYYPDASARDDGVCTRDVEERMMAFFEHWKSKGVAIFDNKIVRYDSFIFASITRTKRIIHVSTKRQA